MNATSCSCCRNVVERTTSFELGPWFLHCVAVTCCMRRRSLFRAWVGHVPETRLVVKASILLFAIQFAKPSCCLR